MKMILIRVNRKITFGSGLAKTPLGELKRSSDLPRRRTVPVPAFRCLCQYPVDRHQGRGAAWAPQIFL